MHFGFDSLEFSMQDWQARQRPHRSSNVLAGEYVAVRADGSPHVLLANGARLKRTGPRFT